MPASVASVGTAASFSSVSIAEMGENDVKNNNKTSSKFLELLVVDEDNVKNKRCDCKFPLSHVNYQGWELYGLHSRYAKSNIPTKTSSSATLRRLVTDKNLKRVINGRPTALGRLINGMKKSPPPPMYEYGNCLRYMVDMDEYKTPGGFLLKQIVKHTPTTNDTDCYWHTDEAKPLSKRTNPFRELQLCPKSLYDLTQQPQQQEGIRRADILLDLTKFGTSEI
ncbi:hypothetical protein GE061_010210 [Apolygus lucorum]|uniref:Uncharacterized protein n=1 Tax=Apolygus lucorum TaxID=248454 RepID=A0A8S9Y2K8_APOLU|nr:hypothetical protein GE061_010210 [Apolygus lucorum]